LGESTSHFTMASCSRTTCNSRIERGACADQGLDMRCNMKVSLPVIAISAVAIASGAWMAHRVAADSQGCHFAPMAGVVGDSATRLSWQQASAGMVYNWDDAAR